MIFKCRCGMKFDMENPTEGTRFRCREWENRTVTRYNIETGEPYQTDLPKSCKEHFVIQIHRGNPYLFRLNPDDQPMPTAIQAPATLG